MFGIQPLTPVIVKVVSDPTPQVTVVDVNGQVLSHDQSEQDAHNPGRGIMTVQREMEQGYTEGIESMLARVLGPGHALARVTVALDMAQVEKTEEKPPETAKADAPAAPVEGQGKGTGAEPKPAPPAGPPCAAGAAIAARRTPAAPVTRSGRRRRWRRGRPSRRGVCGGTVAD